MLVKERMSHPVITVHPKMSMQEALKLMHKERVRRFPVVNKRGKLVGIVSEKDLLNASPSDATSLSIYEVNYLIGQITVKEIMTNDVITITDDTPIEEAARIMVDNKIGGLPIVDDGDVVGIITETDLFKVLLELMGAREPGIRIAALVPNIPGELAQLTKAIFDIGGNILALGTFLGDSSENREVCIKVDGVKQKELEDAIKPFYEKIVDVRKAEFS
jgi:acetoin utilization protein AcuB